MSAATFTFKAVDSTGTPEKGEITGISREAVTAELKARGLTVMDLVEKKTGLSMDISLGPKRVKPQELTVMTRQLATMISSGMTLLRTFYVLEEQVENKLLKEPLSAVREDIEAELSRFRAIRQKHGLPVPDDDKHLEALAAEGRVLLAFTPDGPPSDWTSWGLD